MENRWIMDGWVKLIVPDPRNRPTSQPELYDLQRDPWEKNDLALKEPERVRELKQKLDTWWTPPSQRD